MKTFLQAEWRKLVMANYLVEKELLTPYLPYKTEIDFWDDKCYLSLVGFLFKNTKVNGLKIPFHVNFEEVNLRFYVQYNDNGEWKRGVVFIKEIVPKAAISFIANTIYKENYQTMQMDHSWELNENSLTVEYKWKNKDWNSICITTNLNPGEIENGSEEEFITEHYWGYTKITDNKTSEYRVEHPKWKIYPTKNYSINVNFTDTYGQNFKFLENETPKSVLLAEGSKIVVRNKRFI